MFEVDSLLTLFSMISASNMLVTKQRHRLRLQKVIAKVLGINKQPWLFKIHFVSWRKCRFSDPSKIPFPERSTLRLKYWIFLQNHYYWSNTSVVQDVLYEGEFLPLDESTKLWNIQVVQTELIVFWTLCVLIRKITSYFYKMKEYYYCLCFSIPGQ